MCLFPKSVPNPLYRPNKDGDAPPQCPDYRLQWIDAPCNNCEQCNKQKALSWRIRLCEEKKDMNKKGIRGWMVTLTFSPEALQRLAEHKDVKGLDGYARENKICLIAEQELSDKWYLKFKKRPRRFLITELGHKKGDYHRTTTEHVHMHGVIWTNENLPKYLEELWGNGWIYVDKDQAIGQAGLVYITKYIFKKDGTHPMYKPKIMASKGIGKTYIKNANRHIFDGENTRETYVFENGVKVGLPIYLRNLIWNQHEREQLRLIKLDSGIKWVGKQQFDITTAEGRKWYDDAMKEAQSHSNRMGYAGRNIDEKQREMERIKRNEKFNEKIAIAEKRKQALEEKLKQNDKNRKQ